MKTLAKFLAWLWLCSLHVLAIDGLMAAVRFSLPGWIVWVPVAVLVTNFLPGVDKQLRAVIRRLFLPAIKVDSSRLVVNPGLTLTPAEAHEISTTAPATMHTFKDDAEGWTFACMELESGRNVILKWNAMTKDGHVHVFLMSDEVMDIENPADPEWLIRFGRKGGELTVLEVVPKPGKEKTALEAWTGIERA